MLLTTNYFFKRYQMTYCIQKVISNNTWDDFSIQLIMMLRDNLLCLCRISNLFNDFTHRNIMLQQ